MTQTSAAAVSRGVPLLLVVSVASLHVTILLEGAVLLVIIPVGLSFRNDGLGEDRWDLNPMPPSLSGILEYLSDLFAEGKSYSLLLFNL